MRGAWGGDETQDLRGPSSEPATDRQSIFHSLTSSSSQVHPELEILLPFYRWGWRRQWQPTPVLLPGKSHGWKSLVGCSPWSREESDTTERLHFHFSLSCIGEGNGNPLQCSCLENPRDGGTWWAAIYGVAQSRPGLKQLSSSSSSYRWGNRGQGVSGKGMLVDPVLPKTLSIP